MHNEVYLLILWPNHFMTDQRMQINVIATVVLIITIISKLIMA